MSQRLDMGEEIAQHHQQGLAVTSAVVQVFGRRNAETIDALGRPAFKKRQGTKSREGIRVAVRRALSRTEQRT